MDKQEIYSPDGTLRGCLIESSDRTELIDHHGRLLGVYQPGTNETHDNHGRFIGRGNLLLTLLP